MVSVFLYHVVGDLTVGKPDSTFSLLLLGVSRQKNERLRMVSVFLYHVLGDLTVGKPEIVEFLETKTMESASNARRRRRHLVRQRWSRSTLELWEAWLDLGVDA
jgi:hypothetical protein